MVEGLQWGLQGHVSSVPRKGRTLAGTSSGGSQVSLGVSEVMSGAGMESPVICQSISLLPPKRDGTECPAGLRDVLAQSLCLWGVSRTGDSAGCVSMLTQGLS